MGMLIEAVAALQSERARHSYKIDSDRRVSGYLAHPGGNAAGDAGTKPGLQVVRGRR